MIYNLKHYQLRNNELLEFLAEVIAICNQYSTEPMKLAVVIAVLVADTAEFDKYFKLAPGSQITNELRKLDKNRDNCINGIHLVLEGYAYHYDPAIQKAAHDLILSMDKYGRGLSRLSYEAESSTIKSLVNDWKTNPILVAALTLLAMTAWTVELETSNNLFFSRYMARVNEKASAPQIKTLDQRKITVASYLELIKQIEARIVMAEEPIYNDIVNNLNVIITRYNAIADSHIDDSDAPNAPQA